MQRRNFLSLIPQAAVLASTPVLMRPAFAQDGVNARTITVGCSGALSGPLAGFGQELKIGVDAAMTQINAKGGIQGRALQLQMMDDGYVPTRTVDNVKKMIGESSVFALMSCIGTPNNAAILPMIEENNLPYIAPLTGATSLRKASRHVFHVRASYSDETQRLVSKLVDMGIKNLAIVYLDNAFGKEVLADAQKTLAANGIKATAEVALATDGKNLSGVIEQTLAAKPAAVFLASAGAASTGLVAGLKKVSPMLPIAGLSVALTNDGLKQLGNAVSGLAITMVFPDPNRARIQIVRDYQAAMRAMGKEEFSLGSLESYINTRVLAEGLERAGRDLNRAKLQTALASVRNFDLGGFMVNYQASPFVASKYVDLGVMGSSGRFIG
ncbi:ABC transporter substrate-binding protein [Variovorax sp. PCZ-1]|uniref:ABC transporter substrate-binding protein n=1 Tax=Variovorax sp. PCZ-1 TaxID=2835533 RepID=UPI001BCCEC4F|nr:ABC transporter substrate-binding protein [Variovorax sp. PCZ-1]MBS7808989.1 ABC transporter substrate-binding protein [Variovorax sp. PCZ-1]